MKILIEDILRQAETRAAVIKAVREVTEAAA